MNTPAVNYADRRAPCDGKDWFGWPDDAEIEEMRDAWFAATDAAGEAEEGGRAVQSARLEFVPYIPTAQFILPTAYRNESVRRDHRADHAAVERREEIARFRA